MILLALTLAFGGCGAQTGNGGNEMSTEAVNETEAKAPDVGEGEAFVPENPDAMPVDDDILEVNTDYEAVITKEWYGDLLQRAQLQLGNNKRLKKVIERARSGEKITFATIGGSITEGAGAAKYKECYAYQSYDKFKKTFCEGFEDNVLFANAGVGGTPSVFGDMRYGRDIVERVDEQDSDGLPDIVIIEFAVNDYQEPTVHKCYESMVKDILSAPNEPAVILLFAVFPSKFTLQNELRPIGKRYDLMMVSISDSCMPVIGDGKASKWTEKEFFFDIYHPTTLGHAVMSDCIISTMKAAFEAEESADDIDLTVDPVYGLDYCGIQSIFKRDAEQDKKFSVGGFSENDGGCYSNLPLGQLYADNFHHTAQSGSKPMKFTLTCKNMLIAYRAVNNNTYGSIDILMDGKVVKTIQGNTGSWGQSVADVVFSEDTAKKHTFEIRMAEGDEDKKFTITCLSYTPE